MKFHLIFFLFSPFLLLPPSTFAKYDLNYTEELIQHASQKELHKKRYWKLLLHYEEDLFGVQSEIVHSSFFISPEGKTNPKKELLATIRSLFSNGLQIERLQCRFPARFLWLKEVLSIDESRIQVQECPTYQEYFKKIDPSSIHLVFASYYMGSPSSMFGHTLLRVNNEIDKNLDLLSYAINYSAEIDIGNDSPFKYIIYGLMGGYQGYFMMRPYYNALKEYGEIENRDIWEYELNLNKEQIWKILNHLWELREVGYDYYFFKKNCSYRLLSLIEIADPSLKLREAFGLWTIPGDTIRLLNQKTSLIKSKRYRPSRWSRFQSKLNRLSPFEKEILNQRIDNQNYQGGWEKLATPRKAAVLEALNDFYAYKRNFASPQTRKSTLRERASLRIILPKEKERIPSAPEAGHASSKGALDLGESKLFSPFLAFKNHFSFHELLADQRGYMPSSSIEAMKSEIRYYSKEQSWLFEELTLVKINSFLPVNRYKDSFSWNLETGLKQVRFRECFNCPVYQLNIGGGLTFDLGDGVFYNLLQFEHNNGNSLQGNHQNGVIFSSGVLLHLGDKFRLNLNYKNHEYLHGEKLNYQSYQIDSAMTIATNSDFRFQWKSINDFTEYSLGWNQFF